MTGRSMVERGAEHVDTDCSIETRVARKASVRVSDQIAAEHPHELDDAMPRLAGKLTGRNPKARRDLLLLLAALGLHNPPEED